MGPQDATTAPRAQHAKGYPDPRRCPGRALRIGCPAMAKETGKTPPDRRPDAPGGSDPRAGRRARAAAALRANLKRRRDQARARDAAREPGTEGPEREP